MALELRRTTFLSIIFSILFLSSGADADSGVTYHGRLLKSNGQPVTATNVQFKVQIRTPAPSLCILFEEIYTKDLSLSAGVFTLTLNDGTATSLNKEPYNLDRVFQNRGVFKPEASKCTGTNEYTPGSTDGRVLYISFNDGTFADWEPLPSQAINFVPAAMESVTVGGHRPSNFFRVFDGTTLQTIDPWPIASYEKLLDLITNVSISGGNASIGGNAAGFTGTLAGDVTGGQKTTRVEKIQGYDVAAGLPGAGQVLTWNHASSRWEAANPPSSATPVGAASGDLSGSYPGPVIAPNAITATKINDGAITTAKIQDGSASGQTLRFDGTDWQFAKLHYRDLVNNTFASPWPVMDCSSGQAIVWQSASDSFVCQNMVIGSSNITDGSILTADLADASVSTVKIQDNAVTNDKIASVAVNKVTSGTGLYLTYAPNNIACADGQILKKTSNGWECGADNNAGGTVTSITAGTGLTGGTITGTGTIGLGTELTGLSGLSANGFVKRTGAGTYATSTQVNLTTEVTDVLPIANGGTGGATATAALTNLLPTQNTHAGKVLGTNGTSTSWVSVTNGTVTGVTGTAPISVATGTTTPVISLNASGVQTSHLANGAVTDVKIGTVSVSKITSAASQYLTYAPNGAACTAGQVLKWNNARWECAADTAGTGTVTSVTSANSDIAITNTTTTPALTLNSGTGANQILKLNGSAQIPAVDGSQLTNLNASNVTSGTLPAARLPATAVLNGGNGVGATMTVGTNANYNLDIRTNSTTKMTVLAGGNVGIGTTTPSAKLEVSGQVLSRVYNAGSATSINWNNGNVQYTSANCGAMAFSNMYEGGAYTLIVTGAASGTCSFSQTAAPDTVAAGSFKFVPAIAPTIASRTTVFTFLRAGNIVYVSWIAGY